VLVVKGFVSPNSERREAMLERKRLEYHNFVEQYYSTRHQDIHRDTYRQVLLSFCLLCAFCVSAANANVILCICHTHVPCQIVE